MLRILTLTLFLSGAFLHGLAYSDHTTMRGQLDAIETAMLHFHLDKADSLARALEPAGYREFYRQNIRLYRYLAVQSPADLEAFRTEWKASTDALEDLPENDRFKKTMLAELHGKRAALEFLDGKNLKAVNLVRQCHKLIQQNVKHFPADQTQNKLLGLFNVVFAAVPKKFQWLTKLLGYRGDMDLGMRQLAAAGYYGKILPLEAELIAYYVEKNTLNRPDLAIRRIEQARKREGDGILTDFLLASAYGMQNQGDEALAVLKARASYVSDQRVFFIPYWDYVQAKMWYFREDYPRAREGFRRFLGALEGDIYKVDASFRLGMTEMFLGNEAAALQTFRAIAAYGVSPFDEDSYGQKLAAQFAETLPGPNDQILFKARNRFDGGFYPEALALLDQLNPESLSRSAQTEWYYRKGRVLHAQKKYDKALSTYSAAAVIPGAGEAVWMQAYAAYYMGEIARERENPEAAKAYYRTALSFDGYYYQAGLENRVKAALASMK